MYQLTELVKRNLKIYLRDRSAVFFSLLTMFIVIMLMVFFLGDMNISSITDELAILPGRDAEQDEKNAKLLVLMWTCAGIIPINSVTVTLSALSSMIKDRSSGKLSSIYTAPVSKGVISAGYICSAWAASIIMCLLTLAISEIYCMANGAEIFSLTVHLKLFGMIAVNSFTYSALMYLLTFAAKTEGAWSGLGTVIGTLVGFLGGIYMPVGSLGEGVAAVMKCLPVIYGTAMFREVMTADILKQTFENVPAEMTDIYKDAMGITLTAFDKEVTIPMCLAILIVCGMVFLGAGVAASALSKKTDR